MTQCDKAPPGWCCTRVAGHDGPCAAQQQDDDSAALAAIDKAYHAWRGEKRLPPARAAFHAGATWMAKKLAPHIAGVKGTP